MKIVYAQYAHTHRARGQANGSRDKHVYTVSSTHLQSYTVISALTKFGAYK